MSRPRRVESLSDVRVTMRFSSDEAEEIEKSASAVGATSASFARALVLRVIRGELGAVAPVLALHGRVLAPSTAPGATAAMVSPPAAPLGVKKTRAEMRAERAAAWRAGTAPPERAEPVVVAPPAAPAAPVVPADVEVRAAAEAAGPPWPDWAPFGFIPASIGGPPHRPARGEAVFQEMYRKARENEALAQVAALERRAALAARAPVARPELPDVLPTGERKIPGTRDQYYAINRVTGEER